jgi:hypothetical protein
MNYPDSKKFSKKAESFKSSLIEKAKVKGIWENFGDEEYRKLESLIDISSYTTDENHKREILKNFYDWSTIFDYNQLEKY